ncbi:MAG TPA: hypothetical protein VFC67_25215 [Prolixibacteraceae bacterium]|nr:hypothetical protein [Prolixibacteraceae bacterium]
MKKLLLIGIMVFAIGCTSPPKNRWDLIKEKRNTELKKGIRKDTIFLGFILGMSQKQVNDRFQQLLSENKIIINSNNAYEYNIPIDYPKNTKSTFSDKYLNDSLFSFTLNIEGDSKSAAELIQVSMAGLYQKKYSNPLMVPSILNEKDEDYIFITGNQQIEIDCPLSTTAFVEYFDYQMKERKSAMDDAVQKKKEEKVIKDL